MEKANRVLSEFATLSGLSVNPSKSTCFFAGINGSIKGDLLDCLKMKEGKLPVRYLGVPLISSKLSVADCESLLGKILGRINSWMSKQLSSAGRLQLLSPVLYSIQVYWSNIFISPKKVIKDIERKFNRFLWNGSELGSAKAKVAWEFISVPKNEGGLGLKNLWNGISFHFKTYFGPFF